TVSLSLPQPRARRARVRAAFFAATERPRAPLVRAAFFAARERALGPRLTADERAWRASAGFDPAAWPFRRKAPMVDRPRRRDRRRPGCCGTSVSSSALCRAAAEPPRGGGSLTPARRAFDRPIAIACLADCAPCLPSRM